MATITARAKVTDQYLELIQKFPLRHLRSDRELATAINIVDSLIAKKHLEPGEQDYLDVLTDMVEQYEEETIPMPAVSDADMLRHLIEARGIKQIKLAQEVGISMSTISNVLNGTRKLTRNHISVLANFFGVSAAVFAP
jgi:HTH-type transcriptional regulator / antitoxin HigA